MKFCLALFLCVVFITGCASPKSRARLHPTAFRKLSPADQRLVLKGQVHRGMSQEAVFIAWGEPDEKNAVGGGKDESERWIYQRQLAIKAPWGSFDQWEPGSNLFGMTVPMAVNASAGFGGIGNEGMLLYQPHLRIVDATVKQAVFLNGKLARYDLRNGMFSFDQ